MGLHRNADSLAQACMLPALARDLCRKPCNREVRATGMLFPDVSAYRLNAVFCHAMLRGFGAF
jgi:hypothetical protein